MKVLLVSPIDPKIPSDLKLLMGGENTYTRTLLFSPPKGVCYTYYADALQKGEIEYSFWNYLLSFLMKVRVLPLSAGCHAFKLRKNYDLIHCHAYTLHLSGDRDSLPPVVLGDSIPARWSLTNYFHQNQFRIRLTLWLRRLIHGIAGVYDQDYWLGNFEKLIVMSEFAKKEHVKLGADPQRIAVVYPGLPDRGERRVGKNKSMRILFAGVWFKRKGGVILFKVYKRLRKEMGERVSLTILGPLPRDLDLQGGDFRSLGITHREFVPYSRLVGEFYPKTDILVHVPVKAEGYGLVVQEAMSFGIPAIVSRLGALTEMVVDGETGLVVKQGSVVALERALTRLIEDSSLRERMGKEARKRFVEYFSLPVMHKKYLKIYREAIKAS